jgi:hypothetical protein
MSEFPKKELDSSPNVVSNPNAVEPEPNNPERNAYYVPSKRVVPPSELSSRPEEPPQNTYNNQGDYYENIQSQIAENPYFQVQQPPVVDPNIVPQLPPKKEFLPFNALGDFLIKRWWLILLISILISLITVTLYTFVLKQARPSAEYTNVESRVQGPSSLPSGTPGTWKVVVQNRESVAINQIEVKLNFDKSFKFSKKINPDPSDIAGTTYKLAKLQPVGQGSSDSIISFEGIVTGNIDEDTVMSGEVTYSPTPLLNKPNPRITVPIVPQRTRITAPEIKAVLTTSPTVVQNGSEVELTYSFENLSERELSDLRLRMTYPDKSFVYTSSELNLTSSTNVKVRPDDGNNTWFIATLPRQQTQTLKVRGTINGAEGVKQTFIAEVGAKRGSDYTTLQVKSADIAISAQPLALTTSIEGKGENPYFSPGENISVVVTYQNKSTSTLNNVELFASLDDPSELIDYSTLKYGDGVLSNRIIQWRSSGVKQLENLPPQAKGSVKYTATIKKPDQFLNSGLSQNAYTLTPRIDGKALDQPQVHTDGFVYKATGGITADQKVKKIEDSKLSATQKFFEVTWIVNTRQNRVNDAVFETATNLPPSAWSQSSVTPLSQSTKISYNPLNGSIIWKPGNIESYAGISSPSVTVTFKLLVDVTSGGAFKGTQIFKHVNGRGIDDITLQKYELKLDEYKVTDKE